MRHKLKKIKGFSLIETIIYIALFTMLIGSSFIVVYQLIEGSTTLSKKTIAEEEINFVLRKINWVLSGVVIIHNPTSGYSNNLTIEKYDGTFFDVRLNAGKIELKKTGGSFLPITSDNVAVSSLQFEYIPANGASPAGVIASTTISDISATTTQYIRN